MDIFAAALNSARRNALTSEKTQRFSATSSPLVEVKKLSTSSKTT